ncbi:TRIM2_3 [Mytilus edulis]|uniref:TRIM2_3 n=1 Tax=Mytilus edulis TaxID=6550 RepID=A0A8S3RMQ6_MYTED|nr:TRIM2_3 [Mytilus edulis]
MASSKPVPCGPCKQENENTKADIWCYNCDEGLCSSCSGHHKKFKSTRDHKTIDIQPYKPPIGSMKTECDTHKQQFKWYCPSHLKPCCDECISRSHSKCIGIESLARVVEKTKIEKSKESIDKDINTILLFLNKMADEKTSNIKKGEHQYVRINESIGKIREEINKHLDHLEQKLCKEVNTVWGQEKSKLSGFIFEIDVTKKKLKEMQDDLQTVTEQTSKFQSFLGLHQIGEKVHQCQRYVDEIETNDMAMEVDIQIQQNGEIEKILSDLQSLKSFGEVKVSKTEIAIDRETIVNREAQVEKQKQSYIDKMTMHIETKTSIDDTIKNEISDMICLSDGRIIVVEEYGNVYLLTSDGKPQKQLPIPGEAMSVTQISKDTIAITYPKELTIKIFNIEEEIITKVIELRKSCYGLSISNESLAVGLHGDEICIIDLEGNTRKSIKVQNESNLKFLVYSDNRVIYSDYCGNAVNCYDGSGKQIWQYTQDLKGPIGLCTDTYGNIIVADRGSSRIIAISKDGQDSKVLVRNEDGLKYPKCICLRNDESYGFVCDEYGKYLAKFNLSYD